MISYHNENCLKWYKQGVMGCHHRLSTPASGKLGGQGTPLGTVGPGDVHAEMQVITIS